MAQLPFQAAGEKPVSEDMEEESGLVGVSPGLEHSAGMLGGERKGLGAAFAPCPQGCSIPVPLEDSLGAPPTVHPAWILALGNSPGKALV